MLAGAPRERLLARRQTLVALCRLDPAIRDAPAPTIAITLLDDLQRHGPFAGVFTRPGEPEPVDLLGRRATRTPDDDAPWPATGTDGAGP